MSSNTAATVPSLVKPSAERAKPRSRKRTLGVVVGAVAACAALGYYLVHRGWESTDDAQIDAELVAVPARVGGTVTKVAFVENQHVSAGQLLAELDDAPAKARLAEAEANLASAVAQADAADADAAVVEANARGGRSVAAAGLASASVGASATGDQIREAQARLRSAESTLAQARSDRDRAEVLFGKGAMTRAQRDQAQTAVDLATSGVEGARAQLATVQASVGQARSRVAEASARLHQASPVEAIVRQAQARAAASRAAVDRAKAARDLAALDLSYTKIVAPRDGVASKKSIAEGQNVAAGQPIVQLVPPRVWVTANYKETQVGRMHAGQPARVEVDAFPGVELHGHVESLSGATGSRFALLPPDNASGNYTKVVQRVPVRVALDGLPAGVDLRPGMSVELDVDTRR